MICVEAMDLASPFLDEELGAVQRERVARHLGSCAECAAELEAMRRLDAVMAGSLPAAVRRARRRPGWALAACLLLAFVGTWLMLPAPARLTVQSSQRCYHVAVEGATLLSVEVRDSFETPTRFDDGGLR